MKLIALICLIGGLVALLAIVTVWIVTARQRRRPSRRIDASWSRRQKQLRRRIHWCQGATVLASSFVVLALLGVIMTAADDSAAQSTSSLALSRARRDARSRAKSESKTDRNSRSSASKSGNSLLPSSSSSSSFPSSSSSAPSSSSSSSSAASSSQAAASSSQPAATPTLSGASAEFANTLHRAVALSGGTVTAMDFPASADGSVAQVIITVSSAIADQNTQDKTSYAESALTEVQRVAKQYGVAVPPVVIKAANGTPLAKSSSDNSQMTLE